ncbi:hypothetical protein C8241_13485 [Paracidovorax avenae]|nr:hypothetical protein C8241_13485 [Paracidovorax avenae]
MPDGHGGGLVVGGSPDAELHDAPVSLPDMRVLYVHALVPVPEHSRTGVTAVMSAKQPWTQLWKDPREPG